MADQRPGEDSWIIYRPGGQPRWGSEARRQSIFEALAKRTGGRTIRYWSQVDRRGSEIPLRWFRRNPSAPFPFLASSEQPPVHQIPRITEWTRPRAVAIYDDPIAQSAALGVRLDQGVANDLRARLDASIRTFDRLVVPTASFAALIGLPLERVIVGGNGTHTSLIKPGSWPEQPTIGMVSGAAAGRGIETLIDAAEALRSAHPDLRLRLWLVATSRASEAFLAGIRQRVADAPWVEVASVGYDGLGSALASATVLCVPHPANDYMDVALPVKLLDSLAAGRPLVVTPRTESAAIVRRHGAGTVAGGDTAADLAAALDPYLRDQALSLRIGAAARAAAAHEFDWTIVSARLADALLDSSYPSGGDGWDAHTPGTAGSPS